MVGNNRLWASWSCPDASTRAVTEGRTRVFAAGIDAGADPYDLMVATRTDPSTDFAPPPAECDDGYSLIWRYAGGPPVYVQQIIDFETGGTMDPATLLMPTAIEIDGDTATAYFFAGFFS